jgi:hypothetical protein
MTEGRDEDKRWKKYFPTGPMEAGMTANDVPN